MYLLKLLRVGDLTVWNLLVIPTERSCLADRPFFVSPVPGSQELSRLKLNVSDHLLFREWGTLCQEAEHTTCLLRCSQFKELK